MNHKLLIVDDDEEIRTQMKWALAADYDVLMAGDRAGAVEAFRSARPLVVLLDLGLPPQPANPAEGLASLAEMLGLDRQAKIVVITGQGEKETALQAIGAGACDFLSKPVDVGELKFILKRCFHIAQLEREHRKMQQLLQENTFEGMLGVSPAMQGVFNAIRKVATADAPVLILGESGTGKEMAARAIHQQSGRTDGPFAAINCSAIPETLLESELFGHEKGAFTGAHARRQGRIEMANGGTLFLDEIGEVPLPLQVKLLRFLQEQVIERVGGREQIRIDARIIAATNADLKKSMGAGKFREDLFYRLAVVQLKMPPLREREGDIHFLAQSFLKRYATAKSGLTFDREALRALMDYSWPGNVRELENRVRRAVIMANGKRLTVQDLELPTHSAPTKPVSLKDAREAVERDMVQNALQRHSGKIAAAAAELGISRPTLYELMEKLGISRE
ncbi:MAG: PEP-CTERM-box response regulator transcription factor [Verrucomicrobia bacterium]|nr:PEP-CTERM-box response regulator transcription factor [Verrucomicrobiota bacterium]MDE3098039.1 PEP-CTERM-box response regulator transcription factor [Verrucomicrobiota bacterium]